MAKYDFDFSGFSADDFTHVMEYGRKLRAEEAAANLFGATRGTTMGDVVDGLAFARKFADGYTLQDVPFADAAVFINDFYDALWTFLETAQFTNPHEEGL